MSLRAKKMIEMVEKKFQNMTKNITSEINLSDSDNIRNDCKNILIQQSEITQQISGTNKLVDNNNPSTSGIKTISKNLNHPSCCQKELNFDQYSDFSDFEDSGSEYCPFEGQTTSSESTTTPPYSPITPKQIDQPQYNSNNQLEVETTPRSSKRARKNRAVVKTSKKRCLQKHEWKSVKSKISYNSGIQHLNVHDKLIKSRTLQPPCNCKMKCNEKLDESDRKKNFKTFWDLGDRYRQWNFILKYTEERNKLRTVVNPKINRNANREYFLITTTAFSNSKLKVCREMFLNTLGINSQWIQTAYKKQNEGQGILEPDKRGRFIRNPAASTVQLNQYIIEHIKSFPAIESHYLRKSVTKTYIEGNLNVAIMYRLFLKWLNEKEVSCKITERQYRDIFNTNFNIGFYVPKKDRCEMCTRHDNLPDDEKKNPKNYLAYVEHIENKKLARIVKEADKIKAIDSQNKIEAAVFDFQKVLSTPQSETSIFYYKRKYAVYNFTVFSLNCKKGYCFVWHEILAKRGSSEVASCLKIFIETKIAENGCNEFIFWSDNCAGQNRNKIIFTFYAWAANRYNIKITHRFLEKGHTQNEGDSVHATIEKRVKFQEVFVPAQWYSIIRCAKIKPPLYSVIEMSQNEFLNFKSLSDKFNFAKNTENEKFLSNKVREVIVLSENPSKISYKCDFRTEISKCVEIVKPTPHKGRKSKNKITLDTQPSKLYDSLLPISTLKYNDLLFLCKNNYLKQEYHSFYENLPNVISITNTEEDED